jgi:hypothetical protein
LLLVGALEDVFSPQVRRHCSKARFFAILWQHRSGVAALFHSSDLSQTTQVWQLKSTLLLEESRRIKRSDTQTFSNFSNYFKRVLKFPKTFFQFLQIKCLQLKLKDNLQNSYQISSQHKVPNTWVKQHPKTPKPTKTNENPSPSSSMHKLVPFGSKLVTTWFLWVLEFRDWFLQS